MARPIKGQTRYKDIPYHEKDKTNWSTLSKECLGCKKNFSYFTWRKTPKYCSNKCRTKYQIPWNKDRNFPEFSGEKCHLWKGGVSRGYKTGYYSKEYKDWRKAVFKRDDFACADCGYRGFITAHHIKSFAYHPELRYELSNGKTLCEECHKKTDNYKGRARRVGRTSDVLINK